MDELLAQFLIEGRDLVAQASGDFASLARAPGDAAALDSAFRAIHTLKGSVAIFDMAPAEQMLHAAEDVLDRARRGATTLAPSDVEALIVCLDTVDRCIDDMGETGQLPPGASVDAERAMTLLASARPSSQDAGESGEQGEIPDWLASIVDRHADMIDPSTALIAFRYAPDADCFFRGDDPLAIVRGVPDLLALAMVPVAGVWPSLGDLDPFSCVSMFEGLSAASHDQVVAAFRLVPDQVAVQVVDAMRSRPAAPAEERPSRAGNQMRVDVVRVEALADGLGELIVAINAVSPVADELSQSDPQLATALRRTQATLERVAGQLHRTVSAVRSVPLEPALRRLPRLAREIAETVGNRVMFKMLTGSLEVDKQIADGLFEPLLHLLRNAVDHGIEMPDARAASGKPVEGQIVLKAKRDGDAIAITLSDDGAGIDPARIKRRAIERGIVGPDEAEMLSDMAALQLIFVAGFSTADVVTEISGRGVGMDAVQNAIARLRGSIQVSSEAGRGTSFHIRLPTDSLTTRLLVIEVAGDRYGVALDQVFEMVRIDRAALLPVGLGRACVLRGRTVPVLSLAQLLGRADQETDVAKLVVTQSDGEPVALMVDGFAERINTVIRPPRGVLAALPGIMGSALLGNGDILLVLDLPALAA
jgi:two-component system chemotaxis sensor kinase CheA